ncbi:MAG: homoserine kinase [Actinomycetota bacterium]|nr:homoserine kinase [Actinomycetota bacterium]
MGTAVRTDVRWSQQPVAVEVPASAANLGPGFDSFGLALSLRDRVELEATPTGLDVEVDGADAEDLPRDESHLVVRAVYSALDALGARPGGLRLRCRNRVPHGRGLGSSAAAIVAGLVAARELARRSEVPTQVLDDAGLLQLATDLEGHPDNVAAALLGGFTVAWRGRDGVRAVRLEPDVSVLVVVPVGSVPTAVTRQLLPDQVPHRDAAANSARAGLLAAAMTGLPELLHAATEDRLHQDYREPALPASLRLVRTLRDAGHAAVVSGAGPALLVLRGGAGGLPGGELTDMLATEAPGWTPLPLDVDLVGARVLP